MNAVVNPPAEERAPAKSRILVNSNRLFYEYGIRNVGVDRIIAESSVTKATFYKHYVSKDNLILEYIRGRSQAAKTAVQMSLSATTDPHAALRAVILAQAEQMQGPGFRGSAFINAAAEFPEASDPVRLVITAHREWLVDTLTELMRSLHHPVPGDAADDLVMILDGALAGAYTGDATACIAAMHRLTDTVLADARPGGRGAGQH